MGRCAVVSLSERASERRRGTRGPVPIPGLRRSSVALGLCTPPHRLHGIYGEVSDENPDGDNLLFTDDSLAGDADARGCFREARREGRPSQVCADRVAYGSQVASAPLSTVLAELGHHLSDYDPTLDPDDDVPYPMAVSAAVHEAGHAVAMAALRIPVGGLRLDAEAGRVIALPPDPARPVPTADDAVALLAGIHAQGELHEVLMDGHDLGVSGRYGHALGAAGDLEAIPAGVVLIGVESVALAIVRANWAAVCRVARAALDAPGGDLTWVEILTAIGDGVEGCGADIAHAQRALTELQTGAVERVTRGVIAGYDGP